MSEKYRYEFTESDPKKAQKATQRVLDFFLTIKSGHLEANDRALEYALREMFHDLWNVRSKSIKSESLNAIRRAVLLCKLGSIRPNSVVDYVREAIKEAGAPDLQGLPIDAAILLLNQNSILKKDVCLIFGINPKRPRKLERWVQNKRFKRRGLNGRFLVEDVIDFLRLSGKRSDLLYEISKKKP